MSAPPLQSRHICSWRKAGMSSLLTPFSGQDPRNRRVQFMMAPKVYKDDDFSKSNSAKLSKKASSA